MLVLIKGVKRQVDCIQSGRQLRELLFGNAGQFYLWPDFHERPETLWRTWPLKPTPCNQPITWMPLSQSLSFDSVVWEAAKVRAAEIRGEFDEAMRCPAGAKINKRQADMVRSEHIGVQRQHYTTYSSPSLCRCLPCDAEEKTTRTISQEPSHISNCCSCKVPPWVPVYLSSGLSSRPNFPADRRAKKLNFDSQIFINTFKTGNGGC